MRVRVFAVLSALALWLVAAIPTSAASEGFLQISSSECCLRTARYSGM